jgi:hypothetical protein
MLRRGAEHLNICSNDQITFRKVRSTEISFVHVTVRCTFNLFLVDFSTNIKVLCTYA